jgi:hypothetical protein
VAIKVISTTDSDADDLERIHKEVCGSFAKSSGVVCAHQEHTMSSVASCSTLLFLNWW